MKPAAVIVEAQRLGFAFPGAALLQDLSFVLQPGLSLIRGGDGRGKTSLLRLLAGTLLPQAGVLRCWAADIWYEEAASPEYDATVAQAWLLTRAARFSHWNAAAAATWVDVFSLQEHLHKPMYMLSTGSRRKLGLVGALASGAALTLLDTPFAALDVPSARVLNAALHDAAAQQRRAWVLADAEMPAGLKTVRWAGVIDLGD